MMRRARGALAVLGWVLVLALGCARGRPPIGSVPKRVVSLSPSTSEAVFAMGAGAELVGRSRYCDYPPEIVKLPSVGGYVDPNYETILALQPDLVTGARGPLGPGIEDRFAARGIATYFPDTESFAAIDAMVLGLGDRTGHAEAARTVAAGIDARVAATERSLASAPRVRTILVFGLDPVVAAGPASFADEMIRLAGGTNVVLGGGKYPTLSLERVLALDPDVIVDASMEESAGRERITPEAPGWREARAVRDGHVIPLKDEVVLRPGPRIADGLAMLAGALHPETSLGKAP
jgi:iron complex transport system substrate-binding protein